RCAPVDRLRAVLTVLVVLHHALLAYHPHAPPLANDWSTELAWRAFPVLDAAKMPGADLIVWFNDTFFMALMFLLAGLYAFPALAARGAGGFLRERALRLGVPFVASCLVLAPLAYYPAWLQRAGQGGFAAYVQDWIALPMWPAGPAWFLWVLFAFALGAALLARAGLRDAAIRFGDWCAARPFRAFGLFAGASVLAYVPGERLFGGFDWFAWGPFTAQTCRLGMYAVYFAFGMALGARGTPALFAADGALARRWKRWASLGSLAFVVMMGLVIALFAALAKGALPLGLVLAADVAFCVAGAAISFAAIGLVARRVRGGGAVGTSLERNAFGIYLLHYLFVALLQYLLLGASLPGVAKAAIVFLGALGASWSTTAALLRIPFVARVIGQGPLRTPAPVPLPVT
ncbi:MAG TPA: acyltransferase, partial [Xanthomonadales bacterium]|nr:acyltransferase [Xanthomonadales bacterium]